jgi:hypothetical protein
MGKFQSTKIFDNYTVAIRQWKAQIKVYLTLNIIKPYISRIIWWGGGWQLSGLPSLSSYLS